MTEPAGAPAPPPGPGVQVPFAAPPAERDRRRLWIGLGVGGALLALCCVGGIFGFGALVVQTSRSLLAEATTVVGDYLDALHDRNYPTAYDQLCASLQNQISLDQFQTTEDAQPPLVGYTLDQPRAQGSAVWVKAHVTRENDLQAPDFRLVQEGRGTTALKICAITQ
ncbi:MAG: hypothetical protein V7603_6566 [Micromonosporaceae bacterium]